MDEVARKGDDACYELVDLGRSPSPDPGRATARVGGQYSREHTGTWSSMIGGARSVEHLLTDVAEWSTAPAPLRTPEVAVA